MKDWLKRQYANAKIAWVAVVTIGVLLGYNISISIKPIERVNPTPIERVIDDDVKPLIRFTPPVSKTEVEPKVYSNN